MSRRAKKSRRSTKSFNSPNVRRYNKTQTRIISNRLRAEWKRERLRTQTNCPRCGSPFGSGHSLPTVDHIVPRSKGGADVPANWQLMCRGCNSKKGNQIENRTSKP